MPVSVLRLVQRLMHEWILIEILESAVLYLFAIHV